LGIDVNAFQAAHQGTAIVAIVHANSQAHLARLDFLVL